MKIGDNVLIDKDVKNLRGYALYAQTNQLPLFLYSILGDNKDVLYVYTNQLSTNNFAQNPFSISKSNVTLLTEKEAKAMADKINEKHIKEMKEKVKALEAPHVDIDERKDYRLTDKQFLITTTNYVNIYSREEIDRYKGKIPDLSGSKNYRAGCCALSKTHHDLVVYIPKSWLTYFGYDVEDMKEYFSLLETCEIEFNAEILGTKTLKQVYGKNTALPSMALNLPAHNGYVNPDEDCYEILIRGNSFTPLTYLNFILVRFLYSSLYWNIPFIMMKLKRNLPKATAWECLLLAHLMENYESGYSLVANDTRTAALPSAGNTPKAIRERLRVSNMNSSFKKYTEDIMKIRKLISEENYKEIQKIINKYRDVN